MTKALTTARKLASRKRLSLAEPGGGTYTANGIRDVIAKIKPQYAALLKVLNEPKLREYSGFREFVADGLSAAKMLNTVASRLENVADEFESFGD